MLFGAHHCAPNGFYVIFLALPRVVSCIFRIFANKINNSDVTFCLIELLYI